MSTLVSPSFEINDALLVSLFKDAARDNDNTRALVNVITGERSDAGIKQATISGVWVSSSEYPTHIGYVPSGDRWILSISLRLTERVPNIRGSVNARNNKPKNRKKKQLKEKEREENSRKTMRVLFSFPRLL